jgi:tripartite-type tricarboxylate transporter receptor subunit TctC
MSPYFRLMAGKTLLAITLIILLAAQAGSAAETVKPVAPIAAAAEYPIRAIRLIVPAAPGNAADTSARLVAAELSKVVGQPVVVDNRPGAGGTIAMEVVVRATPDGYTIGHGNLQSLAINYSVVQKLPYDPRKDLQAVVHMTYSPNLLACTPSLPVKTVQELVEYARKNPDKLSNASSGNGGSSHLSGEWFKLMTAIQIVHVPYKSSMQGITDLMEGRVDIMFDNLPTLAPYVKSGKLRGLGQTGQSRSPTLPDVPTIAEAGLPGFEVTAWSGIVVPAATPKAIVNKLNADVNKAMASPALREKFAALGFEPPVGGTPEAFAAHVRKELEKWADVVKRAGIKAE